MIVVSAELAITFLENCEEEAELLLKFIRMSGNEIDISTAESNLKSIKRRLESLRNSSFEQRITA